MWPYRARDRKVGGIFDHGWCCISVLLWQWYCCLYNLEDIFENIVRVHGVAADLARPSHDVGGILWNHLFLQLGTKKSPDHSPKCPESVGCPLRWLPKSSVAQGIRQGGKLVVSPSLMKPWRDVSSIKPLFPGTFLHACETSSSPLTFHFKDLWNMGRWYSGLSWIRNLLKTLNAITRSVFKTQRIIYLLFALSVCSLCVKLIVCWLLLLKQWLLIQISRFHFLHHKNVHESLPNLDKFLDHVFAPILKEWRQWLLLLCYLQNIIKTE